MRTLAIYLLLAPTFAAMGACSSGENSDSAPSSTPATANDTASGPALPADEPAPSSIETGADTSVTEAPPDVSRSREGSGGIVAVADELTMEFDFASTQGRCTASDGQFEARGIDIDDDTAGVTISYATIVAPDTGNVVGTVFQLEIKKDGYVPWAVNSALAGAVADISDSASPGGGVTLAVTGLASGFHESRAPTGVKKPYRLEATCDP